LEWYHKSLEIYERVLGVDHPNTAITYNNIAGVYKDQGDYPKALKWFHKSLAICEKILGPEHPYTISTKESIAAVKQAQKQKH